MIVIIIIIIMSTFCKAASLQTTPEGITVHSVGMLNTGSPGEGKQKWKEQLTRTRGFNGTALCNISRYATLTTPKQLCVFYLTVFTFLTAEAPKDSLSDLNIIQALAE